MVGALTGVDGAEADPRSVPASLGGSSRTLEADQTRSHPTWSDRARGGGSIALVFVLGYLAVTVTLVLVGESIVHASLLDGLRSWDNHASQWLVAHRTSALDQFALRSGRIADTMPVVFVAVAVEVILAVRRHWHELVLVAAGLALELAAFLTVNQIVARPRPDVAKVGSEPSTYSFPSGHIAATIVLWGCIAFLLVRHARPGWRPSVRIVVIAVVALLAAIVGFSRVYRGMHHVTDVVAGAGLGLAALAVAILILRLTERRPWEPAAVRQR